MYIYLNGTPTRYDEALFMFDLSCELKPSRWLRAAMIFRRHREHAIKRQNLQELSMSDFVFMNKEFVFCTNIPLSPIYRRMEF